MQLVYREIQLWRSDNDDQMTARYCDYLQCYIIIINGFQYTYAERVNAENEINRLIEKYNLY